MNFYTWFSINTNYSKKDFEDLIKEMKDIGFKGVIPCIHDSRTFYNSKIIKDSTPILEEYI